MNVGAALRSWFQQTGVEMLGWTLVVVGIPLMPLPGPGTIVLVAGVALLARRYVWAQRLLGPLEAKAIEAAKFGVATWPRIFISFLGGVWLFALGVVWWISPQIPEFSVVSFTIPSWLITTVVSLVVALICGGAVLAMGLLLRAGSRVRAGIVGLVWLLALWYLSAHGPDLSDRGVDVAFGPELPAHGWGTALGLWASAIAAWALLAYSVARWRKPEEVPQPQP